MDYQADGGGSGAGGNPARRTDVRFCRAEAAKWAGYCGADRGNAGRYSGEHLLHQFRSERRGPGGYFEHAVPGEWNASFSYSRLSEAAAASVALMAPPGTQRKRAHLVC